MNKVKLKDVCSKIGDGVHGTPKYVEKSDYYFINGNNLKNGYIIFDEKTKMVSQEEAEKYSLPLNKNTLLMSINGTLGGLAKYRDEKIMLGKSAAYINCEKINLDYLFYYFQQEGVLKNFYNEATGSTIKNLSLNSLQNFEIPFPSLFTQSVIARVLSSFDNKIELNNKINKELENIAKTIYEYWFVQNADKRWEKKKLENVSERVQSGGTPSRKEKSYFQGNINWFTTGELVDTFTLSSIEKISEEAIEQSSAKLFPKGTVLIAIYASPTAGKLGILSEDGTFNQAITGIVPKGEFSTEYIFMTLLIERYKLLSLANGTAQKNLSTQIVKDFKITVPTTKILQKFNKTVSPIFSAIIKNRQENAYLAQLRDFLLPLLMNGQVKVNNKK